MEFIALTFNKLEMVLLNGLIAVLSQQASTVSDHRLGQRTKASSRKASVDGVSQAREGGEASQVGKSLEREVTKIHK